MSRPPERQSTGIEGLDPLLGGGLIPGTLTVLLGATGIGKTQAGLQFAAAGQRQEGRRGVLLDLSARGDPQGHAEYARRMFGWPLEIASPERIPPTGQFFDRLANRPPGDYLHLLAGAGRRVTRDRHDFDQWRRWQAEINERLAAVIAFLYGNLVGGVRRVVVDGIEPVDRPADSVQLELFEYVYHQVLRKDAEWVARDLLRQDYLSQAEQAARFRYDSDRVGCLLLATSRQTMLEELIASPLDQDDLLCGANTIILLGKFARGDRIGRALHVAKHRGSDCTDRIVPYGIDAGGIRIDGSAA